MINKNEMNKDTFRESLKRMFSGNTVITKRDTDGKVLIKNMNNIDIEKLNQFKSELYSSANGYNSFSGGAGGGFNSTHDPIKTQDNFLVANKNVLYSIYNAMDKDPIISSILDIYADEATTKDLNGNIINIYSDDSAIKDILEILFNDILHINEYLWMWIRSMVKYGDCLHYIYVKKDYGVIDIKEISQNNFKIVNIEDETKSYGNWINNTDVNNNTYAYILDNNLEKYYYQYELMHFSNIGDAHFRPYGKSILEGARKHWEILALMEDAMLIHRIMRAPEKRIFKIDVGNLSPQAAKQKLRQTMIDIKKAYVYDNKTGGYNLKYNMQSMLEDFFVTKRGDKYSTEIENLPGLTAAPIEDIDFVLRRLIAAFKVPKAAFGYDSELGSKATYSQEDIRFSRTIERIQNNIIVELTRIASIHLYALGFDISDISNFKLNMTNPSTVSEGLKLELLLQKISAAEAIKNNKLFSDEWIYTNIFKLSKEEINDEIIKLQQSCNRIWAYNEIESTGFSEYSKNKINDDDEHGIDNYEDNYEDNNYDDENSIDSAGQEDISKHDDESEKITTQDDSNTDNKTSSVPTTTDKNKKKVNKITKSAGLNFNSSPFSLT